MNSESKPQRLEIFLVGGLILGICSVMFTSFVGERNDNRQRTCVSNLKNLSLAMKQYNRDNAEKYPPASNWQPALADFTKYESMFHCPSSRSFGYSMNAYVDGLYMEALNVVGQENWGTIPIMFESSILKESQHDVGTSWPKNARHPDGNVVAFEDGHVGIQFPEPHFRSFPPFKPKPPKKAGQLFR